MNFVKNRINSILLPSLFLVPALYGVPSITLDYDFTGDFDATFSQAVGQGTGEWFQDGGVGNFVSPDTTFTNPTLTLDTHYLPYDTDWDLSLDITVPSLYDTNLMENALFGNKFVSAFLGVFFINEFDELFSAAAGLEVVSPYDDGTSRRYVGEYIDQGEFQGTNTVNTAAEAITATLLFDSTDKLLTVRGDTEDLFTLDLDDSETGWGMTEEDFFLISIEGRSNLNEVFMTDPITVDNLTATGAMTGTEVIPEPSAVGLVLGFIALSGILLRRRMSNF